MKSYGKSLLKSLANVRWDVAGRTYGNDHATLIGLIIHWWISLSRKDHWALEGGPSFGYRKRGTGRGGKCDAILCNQEAAVGVLEVEGLRQIPTATKIGKFFAAEYQELQTLKFSILLLYTYEASGRGVKRRYPAVGTPKILGKVAKVSKNYPEKAIIVITLDKVYERYKRGIRARTEYYWGNPSIIEGILYQGGQETARQRYYSALC